MGRTVPPWSVVVAEEEAAWRPFRRALRKEDRPAFDAVFRAARRHAPSAVLAARPVPFESIVLAALVELFREVEALRAEMARETRPATLGAPGGEDPASRWLAGRAHGHGGPVVRAGPDEADRRSAEEGRPAE